MPKTGSTAIQVFLTENRRALNACGIFLPVTGTVRHAHNHRTLANAFAPRGHVPGLIAALAREIEAAGRPERVLLTAENFSLNFSKPGYAGNLLRHCQTMGYRVQVIAYLRSQPAAINSRYCQTVKTWVHAATLNEFAVEDIRNGRHDYAALFSTVLDRPDISVSFRPFTRSHLMNGLVADFLTAIGLGEQDRQAFTQPRPINISHGPKTVAAWLELRRRITLELPDVPRRLLIPIATPLGKIADALGWNEAPFQGVNEALHRGILDRFAASNGAVAQLGWRKSWRDIFAAEEDAIRPLNLFDPAAAEAGERAEFEDFIADAMAFVRMIVTANAAGGGSRGDGSLEGGD